MILLFKNDNLRQKIRTYFKVAWLVCSILIMLLFLIIMIYPDETIIKVNNYLYPEWCNRYDYYMYNNVTNDCLMRCWKYYGCEHNATGNRKNCLCTGGLVGFIGESGNEINMPHIGGIYHEIESNGDFIPGKIPMGLKENKIITEMVILNDTKK